MAYAPTSVVFPSERRSIGIAKETAAGIGQMPTGTLPVKGFIGEDKPIWLPDESLRSAMAMTYGLQEGPYVADITIDASPVYGDTIGHVLYNSLGDYTVTGTASTPTFTAPSGVTAGAGPIAITSATAAVAGTFIQIGTGTTSEVVTVGTGSTVTSIVIAATTPIRFTHVGSTTITTVVAPFTHVFALLNGTGNAQPPTHTFTDQNFINADLARWWPYTCMSEVTITGNAEQLLNWSGKGMGFAGVHPLTTPTVTVSGVPAQPAWNSQVGIVGTVSASPIYQISEWEIVLTREVQAYFTASGQQNPFVIGRGKLSSTGKLNFSPTIDESPLLYMLGNTQPQLQIIATNGLTGASKVSMQIDVQVAAFDASVIEASKALLGYNNTFMAVANTTNTGNSAGYSPLMVTLVNAVSSY